VTQGEVRSLAAGQIVEQITEFAGGSKLVAQVRASKNVKMPAAIFEAAELRLDLPADQVKQWAAGDQVGIEADQEIGPGKRLHILVEKDFECLHRPEENVDSFPNPKQESQQSKPDPA
jgi:hypothetical protein